MIINKYSRESHFQTPNSHQCPPIFRRNAWEVTNSRWIFPGGGGGPPLRLAPSRLDSRKRVRATYGEGATVVPLDPDGAPGGPMGPKVWLDLQHSMQIIPNPHGSARPGLRIPKNYRVSAIIFVWVNLEECDSFQRASVVFWVMAIYANEKGPLNLLAVKETQCAVQSKWLGLDEHSKFQWFQWILASWRTFFWSQKRMISCWSFAPLVDHLHPSGLDGW